MPEKKAQHLLVFLPVSNARTNEYFDNVYLLYINPA